MTRVVSEEETRSTATSSNQSPYQKMSPDTDCVRTTHELGTLRAETETADLENQNGPDEREVGQHDTITRLTEEIAGLREENSGLRSGGRCLPFLTGFAGLCAGVGVSMCIMQHNLCA